MPASFGNALFTGNFFYGTEGPHATQRVIASGSLAFDGGGNYTGNEDASTPLGLFPTIPFAMTYSFFVELIGLRPRRWIRATHRTNSRTLYRRRSSYT